MWPSHMCKLLNMHAFFYRSECWAMLIAERQALVGICLGLVQWHPSPAV